jgi:glycosidase
MTNFLRSLLVSAALLILANFVCAQSSPVITKVEPPNWWANHTINPVRLMVRGENLQNSSVKSLNDSLKTSNTRINENGSYIFFDVEIRRDSKVGKYQFEISNKNGKTYIPFNISPELDSKTNFQGITNDDIIYLIMTDRFANGDTSNDVPKDAPASANGRDNPRAWHGGDIKGVTSKIPYLKELGVTAIWLTPWYQNQNFPIECPNEWCPYTNYHGYHPTDYYEVEDHFGTMKDVQELVRIAHQNGLKVIQDQVANHVSINHEWLKNLPLKTWITPKKINKFNNSVLLSPNGSEAERDNLLNGWFVDVLPDNNHNEPEVVKYQIQNALWWVGMTGVDGIRQDTIQYMPREFIRDWSVALNKQYPKFWMVGEILKTNSAHTAFFQGGKPGWDGIDTKLTSVFDFNLWQASSDVFSGNKPASTLRDVLMYDGLYPDINNVTTVQGNHDVDRFMSNKWATKEGAKLHVAFMLAARGIPQLYYGEEILMTGGHDPDNRKDFLGGWTEDKVNKFAKTGRTADEQEMFEWTQKWLATRKQNIAMREGKTIDVYYDENVYVFRRKKDDSDLLFIFNKSEKEQRIFADKNAIGNEDQICFENGLATIEDKESTMEKKIQNLPINNSKCWAFTDGKIQLSPQPNSVVVLKKTVLSHKPTR